MAQLHKVTGYDNFIEFINNLKPANNELVNVYFSGSKDAVSGESWCPDCVLVQPAVDKAVQSITEPCHFVYVDVGDRAFWKNMTNPFRTDKNTHLMVIPTLIRWKGPQRLEGEQCGNPELLDMFFNDE